MGLDWMPSGGQSSSSSSRVVVVVVVVVDEVVLLLLVVVVVVVAVAVVGKAAAVVCGSDPSTLVRASSNLYCCSGTSLQLQMLPRNNRISNGHIGGHLWGGQNLLSICLCGFHDDDKTELLRTI